MSTYLSSSLTFYSDKITSNMEDFEGEDVIIMSPAVERKRKHARLNPPTPTQWVGQEDTQLHLEMMSA